MISKRFNESASAGALNKKPVPFSLRLSPEERSMLEDRAKGQTLGAYIRGKLFGSAQTERQFKPRRATADKELLAKALGELGQSRLASNMNQIAKAANMGTLPVTPELENDLRHACEAILQMRLLLIRALGLSPGPGVAG